MNLKVFDIWLNRNRVLISKILLKNPCKFRLIILESDHGISQRPCPKTLSQFAPILLIHVTHKYTLFNATFDTSVPLTVPSYWQQHDDKKNKRMHVVNIKIKLKCSCSPYYYYKFSLLFTIYNLIQNWIIYASHMYSYIQHISKGVTIVTNKTTLSRTSFWVSCTILGVFL